MILEANVLASRKRALRGYWPRRKILKVGQFARNLRVAPIEGHC